MFVMSVRGRRLAGLLGALAWWLASPTRAEAGELRRGARLTWARGVDADGCIGASGLEEEVRARLGYDPFALQGEIFVEGTIVRASGRFRADLVLRDANGELLGTRQLTSRERTCGTLGETVAIAITVAIDPNASGARKSEPRETPVEDEEVHAHGREAATAPLPLPRPVPPAPDESAARSTAERARGRSSVTLGAGIGLVPEPTPVVSLHTRGTLGPRWELGAGAHFWAESRASGMGFALTTASLDGCVVPTEAVRSLRWCAEVHAGFLHVAVHAPELAPVTVGMIPWAGAATGPSVSLPLAGPLRLEAGVSAIAPFTRRQAFVRGRPDVVWEQGVVAGRAEVGLGASF